MAEIGSRAGRGPLWLVGTALLAACSALQAPSDAPPAHATAVDACTSTLGGQWRVAVQIDRIDGSMLALVSGDSIATCRTSSDATHAGFGNTTTGVGLHPASSPAALSYLTGGGTNNETSFLAGRTPTSARTVRVDFADGSEETAVLGGGVWLVWLEQPVDAEAAPVVIEALDDAGTVISRLADADGLEPHG